MLSRRTKAALHALVVMARSPGEAVPTAVLHAQIGGSRPYLEQTLSRLVRARLIVSDRGRSGGFSLARDAAAITFADVIRLFDGPLALAPCVSRTAPGTCSDCPGGAACRIRPSLQSARDEVAKVLEATTIASAATDPVSPGP
jgi:Rrf2 family protein